MRASSRPEFCRFFAATATNECVQQLVRNSCRLRDFTANAGGPRNVQSLVGNESVPKIITNSTINLNQHFGNFKP